MTMPGNYQFDERTLQALLTQFRSYTAQIPFEDSDNWDNFFFNNGESVESLVNLLQDPNRRTGELLPHQAFLLAFFQMLETPRRLINTLPERHREYYFRGVLGARPRAAQPDSVVLQFTPQDDLKTLNLPAGLMFDGGQDSSGTSLVYQLDSSLLINHARWSDMRWIVAEKDKPARQTIVLDVAQRIDFPSDGIRLFSDNASTAPVNTGRLLVLPELEGIGGRGRTLDISFSSALTNVSAEIACEGKWHDLGEPVRNGNTVTYSLPDALLLSQQQSLPDYPFDAPLVRLLSEQPKLPSVNKVVIGVANASDILLRTTDGIISDNTSQNYPYGLEPTLGDSIKVMSPSWGGKGLQLDITLQPQWQKKPADFKSYYKGYSDSTISNGDFKVTSDQLVNGLGVKIAELSLFGEGETTTDALILLQRLSANIQPTDNQTFWENASELTLAGKDFQHNVWNNMVRSGKSATVIHPPYNPQLLMKSASWRGTLTAEPQQYVLQPFGALHEAAEPVDSNQLFIGFTDMSPGQQLSLYWQLDTPVPFTADGVSWEYLTSTGWQSLTRQISDETGNFSRSGNSYVTLPKDAVTDNSLMPEGRYWLRASGFEREVVKAEPPQDISTPEPQPDVEAWPWLGGLWTNAAQATLSNATEVADDHFALPLPAGSVSDTVIPFAGLASVSQPLPGWGGGAEESDSAMMMRLARQVAHRGRASTWRDISHLIIDNFPEVHHVRLPGVNILDGLYIPPESGAANYAEEPPVQATRLQEVMLVPRTGINEGTDPERPIFSPTYLQKVRQFISERASPWLELRVLNPYYRTVDVSYRVQWQPGINIQNARQQLEKALRQQFMPWLSGDSMVVLGSTLTISDIIGVMQRQPAVHLVTDVMLDGSYDAIDTTLAVMMLEFNNEETDVADSLKREAN